MIVFKTQIEVRYTNILDFSEAVKTVFSPLIKVANFNIDNAGTYEEKIVLVFKEEGYIIDARWDRMLFIAHGKKDKLFDSNGLLFHYIESLRKLKNLPAFGDITNILLAEWTLNEKTGTDTEIISNFRTDFVTEKFETEGLTVDDLALIFNTKKGDDLISFHFGPYKPSFDIGAHDLQPVIPNEDLAEDLKKKGILSKTTYFQKTSEFSLDSLKKIHKTMRQYNAQLS